MRTWDDERVERIIGALLRLGVVTAAAVVLAGGTVYLARHGREIPDYTVFRGQPEELRSVPGILGGMRRLSGRSIIQLGLLLLIATPVARVAFSMAAFALLKDKLYVAIAALVLAVLLFSLAGGT